MAQRGSGLKYREQVLGASFQEGEGLSTKFDGSGLLDITGLFYSISLQHPGFWACVLCNETDLQKLQFFMSTSLNAVLKPGKP